MKILVRTLLFAFLFAFLFLAILKTAPVKANDGLMMQILDRYVSEHPDKYEAWKNKAKVHYILDSESYDILCRIVEAEATGGTVEQKRNVASCVLTRVASPNWPNTVKGVVFDGIQFSPTIDGRYYSVSITESTIEAVDLTLQEGLMHNCEYFCTKKSYEKPKSWHRKALTYIFYDGIHVYCN